MDNFSEYIKSKLDYFEMSYDENGWLKIQKRLRKNKIIRITKYIGAITSVILISSLVYFSANTKDNIAEFPTKIKSQSTIKHIEQPKIKDVNNTIFLSHETEIKKIEEQTIVYEVYNTDTITNIEETTLVVDNYEINKGIVDSTDSINTNVDSLLVDTTTIIIPEPTYYFPTAFSPNSDGVNDEFYPIGIDLVNLEFQLLIYDRWGNEVFESMNPEYKWNGGNCSQGLYIWIFKYQDNNGIIHIDKGQVTLIK